MTFKQRFEKITKKNNSLLCIGLDPDLEKFPKHLLKNYDPIFDFNKAIIDATSDLVCSYKPNIAFYEAYGIEGLRSLKKTIEYLNTSFKDIPVILDAKRGDIGNTAKMYAKAAFEYWNVDAVTVYPYLGLDAIKPFLDYKNKLTILLIKTSNPDSGVFQNLKVGNSNLPLYLTMANEIKKWNFPNIGLFVGATYPEELGNVRKIFPSSYILTAGIGVQGAKTQKAIKAGVDPRGDNLICNNSREIIYADKSKHFAKKVRNKAKEIRDIINKYRYE